MSTQKPYSRLQGAPQFTIRIPYRQFEVRLSSILLENMKSAEELQQKLYYLLEQLQEMARKLPL